MHKTYKALYDQLKAEGNRIFPTEQARDSALIDEMLNTLYHMLDKLASQEARYLIEED